MKEGHIAAPFTVVVDSREQRPFTFCDITGTAKQGNRRLLIRRECATVPTGDYTIKGFETKVAVERKSESDLLGSVGAARRRFRQAMGRLAEIQYSAVVVECSLTDLAARPPSWSKMSPRAVVGTMIAWSLDFGVPFWLCDTRHQAEVITFKILEKAYARLRR